MLKGIDPLLRGELLKALDEMGHGEEFALVDKNFPSYGVGASVIDLGDVTASRVAKAVFSVFPLDIFGETPILRMGIDDHPGTTNSTHDEVQEIANQSMGKDWPWQEIERQEFYTRVKKVKLVIRSLESAPFACFIFRKGVL
jgi:L-fucose mutarotase